MLTPLRQEVQLCLGQLHLRRKPALRRAGTPDALLATDLPLAADAAAVAAFISAMETRGWRVIPQGMWLLLDHDVPVPEAACVSAAGEVGCCLSILSRHPEGSAPADILREIVKSAEDGAPALEKRCIRLHRELARQLREHQPLPGGLLPYLACAAAICKEDKA